MTVYPDSPTLESKYDDTASIDDKERASSDPPAAVPAQGPLWKRILTGDAAEGYDTQRALGSRHIMMIGALAALRVLATTHTARSHRGHHRHWYFSERRLGRVRRRPRKRAALVPRRRHVLLCRRGRPVSRFDPRAVASPSLDDCSGEMAAYIPVSGAFSVFATRFVSPSLGFTLGEPKFIFVPASYSREPQAGIIGFNGASFSCLRASEDPAPPPYISTHWGGGGGIHPEALASRTDTRDTPSRFATDGEANLG